MKKKLGVSIELNEYEMMLAGSVVNPSEISVGPHDICGMEDLKREIVKKVIYPMQQPRDSHTTLLKPVSPSPPQPTSSSQR